MFCEFCGKKLTEGEVCSCPKAQQEYAKIHPMAGQRTKMPKKQKKSGGSIQINVLTIISYLVLLCGLFCTYYFNFNNDNILMKISFLEKYQMYISYIIPAVILIIGFVLACISMKKTVFRKGSVLAIVLNLLMGAAVIGMMFCNQYIVGEFMQKVTDADADAKSLREYYDITIKKNEALKDKTLQELKTQIEDIMAQFQEGKLSFDEAGQRLDKIKTIGIVTAEVENAQNTIQELQDSWSAFTQARQYEEDKDYKNALLEYETVIKKDKNYVTAQEKIGSIRDIVKEDAEKKAEGLLGEKKFAEAFQAIDSAMEALGSDEDLEQMRKDNEEKYVEYVLEQADSFIKERKISDAENILTQAKNTVSRNEISNKLSELEKYRPVNLSELRVIDSKDIKIEKGLSKDSYGNEYNDALVMTPYQRNESADIYLNVDGRYNRLIGTIASHENMRTESGDDPYRFKVEIYADGNLVFTSGEYTKTTAPADFLADIGQAKVVQIRAQHINEYSGGVTGILGNAKFFNE